VHRNGEHFTCFDKCNILIFLLIFKKIKFAPNEDKLLCMYANVRGIVSMVSELELYVLIRLIRLIFANDKPKGKGDH